MHTLFQKADELSRKVLGGAIEVHREVGAGLLESIYERCLSHELSLLNIKSANQQQVAITYKGLVLEQTLRFDLLVEGCLLIEVKCVEKLLPIHKAQLLSYMKLLNIPVGLLLNFHEPVLKNGVARLILPGANLR